MTRRPKRTAAQLKAKVDAQRRMQSARVNAQALDRAKAKTGSDGKTAQLLHTTPQRISDYRKGRRPMGPAQAARLAYFLGDPILSCVALALADATKVS
ncbi:hypothetical protein [Nevskia sp.]|uniref:hypothetical protein n=1 Tax=Nevskia sp. TaxID=1929292 RepID=UPI0025F754EC|nr:hypothetical protein [Nevskia sp.]